MSTFGNKLIKSMREGVAYAKGKADITAYRIHTIPVDENNEMEKHGCIGSSFDEYLKEEGIFKECQAVAIKRIVGS